MICACNLTVTVQSTCSNTFIVSSPIRRESYVLSRAWEAQEGEGGVEKKSPEVGGSSICSAGKPAIKNRPENLFTLWTHVTDSEPCIFLDDSLMNNWNNSLVITEGVLLSVRLTSMKPTLLSIQHLASPISSIWRRSNWRSWKDKVSCSRVFSAANFCTKAVKYQTKVLIKVCRALLQQNKVIFTRLQ